ncbi:MAG: diguanylate cyclase [Chlorobi bacterium]|nr:diguanylate cyclase [Chlorobiota bacterium]
MNTRADRILQLTRYFTPTDAVYIISIVGGLFALVFLDEVPIRLIGACVVLLSSVFLIINIQSRMREKVAWSRPSVSHHVELTRKVRTNPDGSTQIVFDDFVNSFGDDEQPSLPTHQAGTKSYHNGRRKESEHLQSHPKHSPTRSEPTIEGGQDWGDDNISSVRVKGPVKSPQQPSELISPTGVVNEAEQHTDTQNVQVLAPTVKHVSLSLASLIEESFDEDSAEPRREFTHILKGVMAILRSVMNARTVVYFWYNPDRDELIFEATISDVTDSIRSQRKFAAGEDIVSNIARSGQAQIVCALQQNAECDILPYYFQATGAKSFAGVPVFLHKTVIGVLAVDSAEDDAYNEQTIGILGQCSRLVSMLVQSYTAKYDLQQNARTLETIVHFRRLMQTPGCSIEDIASALVQSALTVVEANGAGVVLYSNERRRWEIVAAAGDNLPLPGTMIETEHSLIAKTLLDGLTADCQHCQSSQRRYWHSERRHDDGYFVAVPLRTHTANYGALFVESMRTRITPQDVVALEIIGEHAGTLIAQLFFDRQFQERALLDSVTNAYNSTAFKIRVTEELARAAETSHYPILALIAFDRYKSIEHSAHIPLFEHVVATIRSVLKPYHVLARLDDSRLGVLLVTISQDKALSLLEHIRKKIATTPLMLEGRSVVVTVSIGLVAARANETPEQLLERAGVALEQALQRGNTVVPFR